MSRQDDLVSSLGKADKLSQLSLCIGDGDLHQRNLDQAMVHLRARELSPDALASHHSYSSYYSHSIVPGGFDVTS